MYAGHFDFAVPMLQRVPALYSRDECAGILDTVRDADWLAATINTAHGREVNERVRNSLTALVRDRALAVELWNRIREHLPASMAAEWHAVLHAGSPVTRGTKHVLRTDVLFRP